MVSKGKSTANRVKGNVKTATGRATGNKSLAAKGHAEKAKGNARAAGKKVKDTLKS